MRRHPTRWLFVIFLIGGIAGFTALWEASAPASEGSRPAVGGIYVEGVAGSPSRINPLFAGYNEVDRALAGLIFSGLTRLDDQGRAFPDLAETWELSQDGKVYLFRLRHGLVWQDGTSLTADDVVFTYGLLSSPALRAPPSVARLLGDARVAKVDRLTVRIELDQPFAPLPSFLTLGILPAHLLAGVDPAALFDDAFNQRPVGSGPYRLEALSGQRALLVANPAFHFGQPYIQRIEFRFYRDDAAVLAALRAREIQGALLSPGLSPNDLIDLQRRGHLRVHSLRTGSLTYVYFNLNLPLFQDRRMRQALTYALDREALAALAGGLPADTPVVPGTWAYASTPPHYDFDHQRAALLLDEAGWRLTDRGVRSNGNTDLLLTLSTNNDPVRVAVAEAVAASWRAVGISVRVEVLGATDLLRDRLDPRNYEVALFAYHSEGDPDPYLAWHSTQAPSGGRNLSGLADVRFDRLLEEARLLASMGRRMEIYRSFQSLFADELPAIPLYTAAWTYVLPAEMRGVRIGFFDNAASRFWQVQEWHLRTR